MTQLPHPKARTLDARDRRFRYVPQPPPNDPDYEFKVREAFVEIAAYNHIFGGVGLPTPYLYPGSRYTNYGSYERVMTECRHGKFFEIGDWQNLAHPQRKDWQRQHNPLFNTNSQMAMEELKKRGLLFPLVPSRSSSPMHDAYMCFTLASFAQQLPPGFAMEHQHEVLRRVGLTTELKVGNKTGTPDATFMLHTPKRDLLVFLELDRANEQLSMSKTQRETWDSKLDFYRSLITGLTSTGIAHYEQLFKQRSIKHGGEKPFGAILLINTITATNLENILELVANKFGKAQYIMGQYVPGFGRQFHVPGNLLPVYTQPWYRAGYAPYTFTESGK